MAKLEPGMVQLEAVGSVTICGQKYRKGDLIRPLNEITANRLIKSGVGRLPKSKDQPKKKEQKQPDTTTKEAKPKTATKGKMKQPIKKSE